ncbi:unnamed protein product [Hermetia illucens]|uniref:Calponin-homology (CH) domain-containing protein n=1 Tax=Hermetia illucens TaxID=343691 RepID=A0A7R8URB5_HERIL|nr:sperm flagellar protein 1-like [Hermetia illucens]CAD7084638.1 unnamed protein product [Hermetia illucens]
MKELKKEQLEDLYVWLEKFEMPQINRNVNRNFSDCVLLAQILKQLYPKFVDIHNYPPRNSTALKLDNWQTLNRKVLQKLGLSQSNESLDRLAKGVPGAIEHLLYQIMIQSNMDLQRNKIPTNDNNIDDDENIMIVNVSKKVGDALVQVPQKMILYSMYEQAQDEIAEKDRTIALLSQKVTHLENFLKLKSERIENLCCQLTGGGPSKRYFNGESVIVSHPNSSSCLSY